MIRWYATGTGIDDRIRAEGRTRNENLALREQIERDSMFEDIAGSSEPLRKVLHQLRKVAPSDSSVLAKLESLVFGNESATEVETSVSDNEVATLAADS